MLALGFRGLAPPTGAPLRDLPVMEPLNSLFPPHLPLSHFRCLFTNCPKGPEQQHDPDTEKASFPGAQGWMQTLPSSQGQKPLLPSTEPPALCSPKDFSQLRSVPLLFMFREELCG